MTIIDNVTPLITFNELKAGDIFRTADNDICMKIIPSSDDDATKCVSLKDGLGFSLSDQYLVCPLNNVNLVIN